MSSKDENIDFMQLIDKNDTIFVLTPKYGYFFPPNVNRGKPLYNLKKRQSIVLGTTSFLYQSYDSNLSPNFGLGLVICDNDNYKVEFHRMTERGQIKQPNSFSLDNIFSPLSCKNWVEEVQLFVSFSDTRFGEIYNLILIWNHPDRNGQVTVLEADNDGVRIIKNKNLDDMIDLSFVRVFGDSDAVTGVYHLLENATFNISF
ncbi:hypothetical protein BGP_0728 [Beggiatoa sp. PS]|nr:hypothetical protein BGP_0728 [Beggiatoa sp. PS]